MSGLSLNTGFRVNGAYTPMTPASAQASTSMGSTVGQRAYGISGTGISPNNKVPGYGSVLVGAISLGILVYLWFTLPE